MDRKQWLCSAAAVVLVGLAYGVAASYLSAPRTFWSSDNSVRFVQLESLRLQKHGSLAAVYPAADVDPFHRFFPIAEGFAYRRDGQTYLSYPWLFPLISSPSYGWFGHGGLLVVPVLSALAATWLVARVVGRDLPAAGLGAALLVGLASPLFVYAVVFWDHSLVTALTTAAVALLLGERASRLGWCAIGTAGLLLGLAAWFRNEAYLFLAAVGVGLLGSRRWGAALAVAVGSMVSLLPLWVYNMWWFGQPLGYKARALMQAAAEPGLLGYLRVRAFVAYDALLSLENYTRAFLPERLLEATVVAAVVLLGGAFVRAGLRSGSPAQTAVGGLCLAGVGMGIAAAKLPVMGLVASCPWVALTWCREPTDRRERFLWTVVGIYLAGVIAVGNVGGLQWGPRYLLPVIPVLGILVGKTFSWAYSQRRELQWVMAGVVMAVLVSGVAVQALGIRGIRGSLDVHRAIEDVIGASPYELVVTGYEPMFAVLGHLYFEKKLMAVDSQEELRELVAALAEARVEGWTYVPRFARGFDAGLVERWSDGGPWRFRVESDRTPLVVEFGGARPVRLVTYRGVAGSEGR